MCEPYYNRWDIIDAYFWFFNHYHEGQGSLKYERMCRITDYYEPGLYAREPRTENSNTIYKQLVLKQEACKERDPNCPACKAMGWYRARHHDGGCGRFHERTPSVGRRS